MLALLLLAAIAAPASSALAGSPHRPVAVPGSIGIRLVGVPADAAYGQLARSYIVGRLAPGTRDRRQVEIINSTRSIANVTVYAAAAGVVKGRFEFAPGHGRNELSSWTRISRGGLQVPPGASIADSLTISVSKDASAGERYGLVWAQVSAPAASSGGITLVNRVGIRMYVSIGPGGAPPANFSIGSLTARRSATGQPLVVASVHNTGRRTIDLIGTLTLSHGPGGLSAGPFRVALEPALTPGAREPATVKLAKVLPRGPWRAQIRLRDGFVVRTARAKISFPALPPH